MTSSSRKEKGTGESASIRLSTLASHYHSQQEIWDIGCDHGQLGLSFIGNESVKDIYLVDPSAPVITKLKQFIDSHIPRENLSQNIHLLHQNGQSLQLSPFSKSLFIAGMGGGEILEILSHLIPQLSGNDTVIISPHRKVLELREWLHQSELRLKTEFVIEENRQFYPVLVLNKCSDLPKISLYGDKIWHGRVGERYLEKEFRAFAGHRDPLSRKYVECLQDIIAGKETKEIL